MGIGADNTTSVDNTLKQGLGFETFPNPATATVQLQATVDIQAVQLFDINGRLVSEIKEVNHTHYQLPVHQLSEGMYFAKVRFERGVVSEKILVERE